MSDASFDSSAWLAAISEVETVSKLISERYGLVLAASKRSRAARSDAAAETVLALDVVLPDGGTALAERLAKLGVDTDASGSEVANTDVLVDRIARSRHAFESVANNTGQATREMRTLTRTVRTTVEDLDAFVSVTREGVLGADDTSIVGMFRANAQALQLLNMLLSASTSMALSIAQGHTPPKGVTMDEALDAVTTVVGPEGELQNVVTDLMNNRRDMTAAQKTSLRQPLGDAAAALAHTQQHVRFGQLELSSGSLDVVATLLASVGALEATCSDLVLAAYPEFVPDELFKSLGPTDTPPF